jgi:hypothetical protein
VGEMRAESVASRGRYEGVGSSRARCQCRRGSGVGSVPVTCACAGAGDVTVAVAVAIATATAETVLSEGAGVNRRQRDPFRWCRRRRRRRRQGPRLLDVRDERRPEGIRVARSSQHAVPWVSEVHATAGEVKCVKSQGEVRRIEVQDGGGETLSVVGYAEDGGWRKRMSERMWEGRWKVCLWAVGFWRTEEDGGGHGGQ